MDSSQGPESGANTHWEAAYRLADVLSAGIVSDPVIQNRRERARRAFRIDVGLSDEERARIPPSVAPVVAWASREWAELFDRWTEAKEGWAFPSGFAALFFFRVLWANQRLLLRGHFDSSWTLQTTLARARSVGTPYLRSALGSAEQFLGQLEDAKLVERFGPRAVSKDHREAILQHYGFPTDLLDFTYSHDVALYFAEGELPDRDSTLERRPSRGAIYALPSAVLPDEACLYTLPPTIQRPTLQRGVFIAGLSPEAQKRLEQFKFVFVHQTYPSWNSIGGLSWRSPVPMSSYLLPRGDAIEAIAQPFIERLHEERMRNQSDKGGSDG